MPLVDEQGRVFGRFNLIDLAIGFIVVALVPLGYAAYVLFRVPPPRLISIEPATRQLDAEPRIIIHGENLRPYMRISFDNNQTRTFLFKDDKTAEVTYADVPPGVYDVVLYDFSQERARLPKGFTITPPALPATKVHVAGFLTGVTPQLLAKYKVGYDFPTAGRLLAIGTPSEDFARIQTGDHPTEIPVPKTMKVPALLEMPCRVQQSVAGLGECKSGPGPVLGPGVYVVMPSYEGRQPLLVLDVRPAMELPQIEVGVRVAGQDDAIRMMKKGDADTGMSQNPFATGATVLVPATTGNHEMVLKVPAVPSLEGWQYMGQILRVGSTIRFQSPLYAINGVVSSLPPLPVKGGTK